MRPLPGTRVVSALLAAVVVVDVVAMMIHLSLSKSILFDAPDKRNGGNSERAAVVFYGDHGRSSIDRVETAVGLFRNGDVAHILFVGGYRPEEALFGAEVMRNHAVARGVSVRATATGAGSFDTLTNLDQVCPGLRRADEFGMPDEIVLVSDGLHLLRIRDHLARVPCMPQDRILMIRSPFVMTWPQIYLRVHSDWLSRILLGFIGETTYLELLEKHRLGSFGQDA